MSEAKAGDAAKAVPTGSAVLNFKMRGPSEQEATKRAQKLQLQGVKYEPPATDPLELHTCGFAKTMASAVFIMGLDPDLAASSVGFFSGPLEARSLVGKPEVDRKRQEVRIALPNGKVITARLVGSQGCVVLPPDRDDVLFTPLLVAPARSLPDPQKTLWPMGDVLPDTPLPNEIDAKLLQQAIDAAFSPAEAMTCAFVVTHRGRIIGERYREGITHSTPIDSWSMGKSISATLMSLLIRDKVCPSAHACAGCCCAGYADSQLPFARFPWRTVR